MKCTFVLRIYVTYYVACAARRSHALGPGIVRSDVGNETWGGKYNVRKIVMAMFCLKKLLNSRTPSIIPYISPYNNIFIL